MTDREKVIKGLSRHGNSDCEYDKETMCPYWGESHCSSRLCLDALALLKAQEPRVMTLEEALGDGEVWFEFRPANVGRYADCYMNDGGDRTCVYFTGKSHMSLFENAEYGKYWRCWTSRPTEEQREAIPWE